MKRKPSQRLLNELAERLVGISVQVAEKVSDDALGQVALGKCMLVIWRTSEICECCNKPVIRICTTRKTRRPLEEIFQ